MTRLTVNGQAHDIDVDSDTPLLWALRDTLGLMGTKFGCGIAQCGACTVHVDGPPVRSCALPVGAVGDKHITTIEGLGSDDALHPVQRAWVEHDVPQCGYCQSGMIMAVAALLQDNAEPDRRRHRRGHHQHLPLRHLSAHPCRDSRRRKPARERDKDAMSRAPRINRRAFLASAAAVGGALALGFDIPLRFKNRPRLRICSAKSPPGS